MADKIVILVVDDESINLKLMNALLSPLGYDVILAENGAKALNLMSENDVDLVLLDVMMPGMSGFEVLQKIKEDSEYTRIPVVLVTALSDISDRVKALELGADDFLTKPVEKIELRARVQSLLKVKAYYDHLKNYQEELENEVERRTEMLRLAYDEIRAASLDTIVRLSRAAEYKDEDTAEHIQRMSHYAAAIATRMGLNERTVETVLYASPMHDVGKIGIPDSILLKPGPLNNEEWITMKEHTTIGGRILEGAAGGFVKLGETIALTHHEKWDGSGYPKGLKGKEIPLAARITALADVFDALVSDRPYRKKSFTVEEAFEIIREGDGSHFDPKVVEVFFNMADEILEIKKKYKDK